IDEVHALFDAWVEDDVFAGVIDEAGLLVMKLAVHEWIANLVQHAVFRHGAPVVLVTVATEDAGVRCRIEDNSDGFDFRSQVAQQEGAVFGPEPTERGRGLLMMIACTEDLAYTTTEAGTQRLEFVVRAPMTPDSMAPLFPADHHPS